MWTRILLDDLLVAEDSRSIEITSALSHPNSANQSLARATNPRAKLQEKNKQVQSKVTIPNKVVVMVDPITMHANGDSNMDISTKYTCSYGHGMCYSCQEFCELIDRLVQSQAKNVLNPLIHKVALILLYMWLASSNTKMGGRQECKGGGGISIGLYYKSKSNESNTCNNGSKNSSNS